jgi:hypothetical protein
MVSTMWNFPDLSHGFECCSIVQCRHHHGSEPSFQWGRTVRVVRRKDKVLQHEELLKYPLSISLTFQWGIINSEEIINNEGITKKQHSGCISLKYSNSTQYITNISIYIPVVYIFINTHNIFHSNAQPFGQRPVRVPPCAPPLVPWLWRRSIPGGRLF